MLACWRFCDVVARTAAASPRRPAFRLPGEVLTSRAIITGKESKYDSVEQLKGTTFGISRLGRQVAQFEFM